MIIMQGSYSDVAKYYVDKIVAWFLKEPIPKTTLHRKTRKIIKPKIETISHTLTKEIEKQLEKLENYTPNIKSKSTQTMSSRLIHNRSTIWKINKETLRKKATLEAEIFKKNQQ